MQEKNKAYQVVKHQYVTEKSTMLGNLKRADSNPSLRRCESPKYVFVVDKDANKHQIAQAIEEIYKNEGIKVVSVNTINVKAKPKRRRGRPGFTKPFKKAIVTLRPVDSLDQV